MKSENLENKKESKIKMSLKKFISIFKKKKRKDDSIYPMF